MNTYEQCKALRSAILRRAGEVMNYTNWSAEFSADQMRDIHQDFGGRIMPIDVTQLTADQMDELGFGRWSEENPMRLIPLWLYQFLADEMEIECIDGERRRVKRSEIDNDNRMGFLAYGVPPNTELYGARTDITTQTSHNDLDHHKIGPRHRRSRQPVPLHRWPTRPHRRLPC